MIKIIILSPFYGISFVCGFLFRSIHAGFVEGYRYVPGQIMAQTIKDFNEEVLRKQREAPSIVDGDNSVSSGNVIVKKDNAE